MNTNLSGINQIGLIVLKEDKVVSTKDELLKNIKNYVNVIHDNDNVESSNVLTNMLKEILKTSKNEINVKNVSNLNNDHKGVNEDLSITKPLQDVNINTNLN